jgi:hypothetical protein
LNGAISEFPNQHGLKFGFPAIVPATGIFLLNQLESFGVFREVLPTLAKVKGECQGTIVEFGEVAVERAVNAGHG